jgi:hypothetical protein
MGVRKGERKKRRSTLGGSQKKKGRRSYAYASGGSSLPWSFGPFGVAGAASAVVGSASQGFAGGQASYGGAATYAPQVGPIQTQIP